MRNKNTHPIFRVGTYFIQWVKIDPFLLRKEDIENPPEVRQRLFPRLFRVRDHRFFHRKPNRKRHKCISYRAFHSFFVLLFPKKALLFHTLLKF